MMLHNLQFQEFSIIPRIAILQFTDLIARIAALIDIKLQVKFHMYNYFSGFLAG